MASVRLTFQGLRELRDALQMLPADLTRDAAQAVEDTAQEAAAEVRDVYPIESGNLSDHVVVRRKAPPNRYGVRVQVASTSKHAHLYEFGSQTRQTADGWNRGAMPPAPRDKSMIPIMVRHRRRLLSVLVGIVESVGFKVRDV